MNFKLTTVILLVALLTIQTGDAWLVRFRKVGRFIRRAWKGIKRLGGKVVNIGRKLYKGYKKHSHWINPVLRWLGDDRDQKFAALQTLKDQDATGFDEFVQEVQEAMKTAYPDEDTSDIVVLLNDLADATPEELRDIDEQLKEIDWNDLDENDQFPRVFADALATRVANLESY